MKLGLPEADMDATETARLRLLREAKQRGLYYDYLEVSSSLREI